MSDTAVVEIEFHTGDRVRWKEAGRDGTVTAQFIDGYVSLMLDDGSPAELFATSLEKLADRPSR